MAVSSQSAHGYYTKFLYTFQYFMTATEPTDELQMYREVNEELRRLYDYIVKSFEHMKNKALALLVGEVAM